jgi:hypothetical protein
VQNGPTFGGGFGGGPAFKGAAIAPTTPVPAAVQSDPAFGGGFGGGPAFKGAVFAPAAGTAGPGVAMRGPAF